MINLFFGDAISMLTTTAVLGMFAFIAISFVKWDRIQKWGRLIFIFVVAGTAISGLAATRDAYMTNQAAFSVTSMQSTVCSLAGGLIFMTAILALFIRKQAFRRFGFRLISFFFVAQVFVIEVSRIFAL